MVDKELDLVAVEPTIDESKWHQIDEQLLIEIEKDELNNQSQLVHQNLSDDDEILQAKENVVEGKLFSTFEDIGSSETSKKAS